MTRGPNCPFSFVLMTMIVFEKLKGFVVVVSAFINVFTMVRMVKRNMVVKKNTHLLLLYTRLA